MKFGNLSIRLVVPWIIVGLFALSMLSTLGSADIFPRTGAFPLNGDNDLIVDGSILVHSNIDFTLTGNLIIRNGGKFILSNSTLTIVQSYPEQYRITVENGEFTMFHSKLQIIQKTTVTFEKDSQIKFYYSTFNTPGTIISDDSSITLSGSSLSAEQLSLNARYLFVQSSIIYSKSIITVSSSQLISIIDSRIFGNLLFVSSIFSTSAELTNSSSYSITTDSNSNVTIYRYLRINVVDVLGTEVAGLPVTLYSFNGTMPSPSGVTRSTGLDGSVLFKVKTDIIDNSISGGSKFVGNYLVNVSYSGTVTVYNEVSITMPYYRPLSDAEILSENQPIVKRIVINDIVPPIIYKENNDILVNGTRTITLDDSDDEPSTLTYLVDGNIKLTEQATFVLSDNASIGFRFVNGLNRFIIIEKNARLILKNGSSIFSNGAQLSIYIKDNGTLEILDSKIEGLIALASGSINAKNSVFNASLYAKYGDITLDGVIFQGNSFFADIKKLTIKNSVFTLSKEPSFRATNLLLENITLNQKLSLSANGNPFVNITNVSAREIVPLNNTTIIHYQYLKVHLQDGNNRSVKDVMIKIYDPLNRAEVNNENKTTDNLGNVYFRLKSEVIDVLGTHFYGNYLINATYADTRKGTVHYAEPITIALEKSISVIMQFREFIVEPQYLQLTNLKWTPTTPIPSGKFTITGRVLTNENNPAVNSSVYIYIKGIQDKVYITTTNIQGDFSIEIISPATTGDYILNITSTLIAGTPEEPFEVSGAVEVPFSVQQESKPEVDLWSAFLLYGGIIVILLGVFYIIGAILRARHEIRYPSRELTLSDWARAELSREEVRLLGKKKR